MKHLRTKKKDERKGKRKNELARQRKTKGGRDVINIVHAETALTRAKMIFGHLNAKALTAADLRAFARQAPVLAEALIEWIKMIVELPCHLPTPNHNPLPDLLFRITKILTKTSVLNPCKKLVG